MDQPQIRLRKLRNNEWWGFRRHLLLILVCVSVASPRFSPDRPDWNSGRSPSSETYRFNVAQSPNGLYFTVNPATTMTGPVLTTSNHQSYLTRVFRILVAEGDRVASDLRLGAATSPEDSRAYWAFMVAALTVPYHEGAYQHFRELPQLGGLCQQSLNSGSVIQQRLQRAKSGGSTNLIHELTVAYGSFVRFFRTSKGGDAMVMPDCAGLDSGSPAVQLIGSGDALSIGMLQLNVAYHNEYFSGKLYGDVGETIRYGLGFYKSGDGPRGNGFEPLFRRALQGSSQQNLSCLTAGADAGDTINYRNLIRAGWTIYNGGAGAAVCRLSQGDSNDRAFSASLSTVLNTRSASNEMMQNLKGADLAAYLEIVDNFVNHRSARAHLDQVLVLASKGSDAPISSTTVVAPQPVSVATKVSDLRIRSGPSLESSVCGTLPENTTLEVLGQADGGLWSQVRMDDANAARLSGCGGKFFVITSALSGAAGQAPVAATGPANRGAVVNAYELNVRNSAPSGRILRVLRRGEHVVITGSKKLDRSATSVWYQIQPDNGWVLGQDIQVQAQGQE